MSAARPLSIQLRTSPWMSWYRSFVPEADIERGCHASLPADGRRLFDRHDELLAPSSRTGVGKRPRRI
jgi:hypothetical protein